MKYSIYKFFIIVFLILVSGNIDAQNRQELSKIALEIEQEGKELFLLEKTAWLGSDILREVHKNPEKVGGYFSYLKDGGSVCVFFSRDKNPNVIASVSFDPLFTESNTVVNLTERTLYREEKELYQIRKKALEMVNTDSLFKTYSNSNLNIIPMVYKGIPKVYVLTSPEQAGVILFGNDYEIIFNQNSEMVSKRALHKGLIPIYYEGRNGLAKASVHSHVSGKDEFITPTDICSLMLYQDFIPWERHYVMTPKFVSVWNCKQNKLNILTREEFDKSVNSGK